MMIILPYLFILCALTAKQKCYVLHNTISFYTLHTVWFSVYTFLYIIVCWAPLLMQSTKLVVLSNLAYAMEAILIVVIFEFYTFLLHIAKFLQECLISL